MSKMSKGNSENLSLPPNSSRSNLSRKSNVTNMDDSKSKLNVTAEGDAKSPEPMTDL